jgi:NADH:ubiquinone oxidoreductase subunit 5 (subunit L)/multisubunit Na+/H+ antiporter MnhA subunit
VERAGDRSLNLTGLFHITASHWLVLAASSASTASSSRPGGFDPANTLPWSVPLLLLAPLFGFVAVLTGVRSRRAASNLAMLTALVMLVGTGLVAWARFRQSTPYRIALPWINIPVSFSGDQRFQGFGVDVAISVDRYTLAGLAALLIAVLVALVWHRVAGAREPGQIRYHANVLLLMLSAAGVLVSSDLGELFGFWAVTGLASYLLLGQRWGTEAAARASRLALALPFLGDMALLSGVGLLYSRFGSIDLTKLPPMLHTTPGVGLKSLTLIALLLSAAAFIRACLWPFTGWLSASIDAPASLLALVAAVWPILAGSLLLRSLPIVQAAGPQARPAMSVALGLAAVVGPLLGLIGTELRRSLLLASSGAVALALLGLLNPTSAAAGFTGLLAVSLGRAGAHVSATAAGGAMRTVDLRQMGGAARRMPMTTAGIVVSTAAFTLGPAAAAAWRPRTLIWIALGLGLFAVAVAAWRVPFAVASGPLRRRRAFEPERVREVPGAVSGAAIAAGVAGLVAAVLSFFTAWVAYLDPGRHDQAPVGTYVLAVGAVVAGVAVAGLVFGARKDGSLAFSGRLGARLGTAWAIGGGLLGRYVARPGLGVVNGVEGVGLPAAEGGLGRAAAAAGGVAGRPLPWLALVAVGAVVLVVVFGLVSTGAKL